MFGAREQAAIWIGQLDSMNWFKLRPIRSTDFMHWINHLVLAYDMTQSYYQYYWYDAYSNDSYPKHSRLDSTGDGDVTTESTSSLKSSPLIAKIPGHVGYVFDYLDESILKFQFRFEFQSTAWWNIQSSKHSTQGWYTRVYSLEDLRIPYLRKTSWKVFSNVISTNIYGLLRYGIC